MGSSGPRGGWWPPDVVIGATITNLGRKVATHFDVTASMFPFVGTHTPISSAVNYGIFVRSAESKKKRKKSRGQSEFIYRTKETSMKIEELQDYNSWIGNSPERIKSEVIAKGGWAIVFPAAEAFPLWASRVRNYFNECPQQLKLLSKGEGRRAALAALNFKILDVSTDAFYAKQALSGDVYHDRSGQKWFEMSTAGAGYHFEDRNWIESQGKVAKALKGKVTPQSQIPVFKLISPDLTGGSLELCIHNPQVYNSVWQALNPFTGGTGGKSTIGSVGKWVDLHGEVVNHEIYKGSYNYSETVRSGMAAHERMDITPHRSTFSFYLNPPRGSSMSTRRFPKDDNGRPIVFKGGICR